MIQININASIFHQDAFQKVYTLLQHKNRDYVFHDNGLTIRSNNTNIRNLSLKAFKDFQAKRDFKFKNHTVISNHFYPIDYNTPDHKIQFYNSLINDDIIWVSSNIGMFELNLEGEILNYHPIHVWNFTFFKDKLVNVVPYGGVRIFDDINTMDYDYFHNWNNPNIPADIVSIASFDNAIYFASALSGLYEYKDGVFKSFVETKEFIEPKLKRITTTSNGNLIVVTDFNDVYELDVTKQPIQIIRYISHELIKGSSTAFVSEIDGVLYIGTNLGINVFKGKKYFFINKSQGFTNYNINKAIKIGNKLYVLTSQGFYVLDNSYFNRINTEINSVRITKILVNNSQLGFEAIDNLQNGLVLDYNQNNINIYFTLINEKFPDKLKFKYRLKSTEPWIDLIYDTQINLSYLDRGVYDLEIQISNEDNGSLTVESLLKIEIKPPFYLKLPFILVVIVVVILITLFIIKLRINIIQSSQRKKMKLIELQAEQEKKQLMFDKQLAEVKLQALKSQMNSHFLFNVLSSIQYFIIKKDVDNALYYLERFSSLIRRTLDFSDKRTISLKEEIDYLKQYIEIENIRVENPISFEIYVEPNLNLNTIEISPLLLQPFVENSIVHAFPDTITNPIIQIFVERFKDNIQVIIKDNGIGNMKFKSNTHDSKGISIVKKRLDLTQKNYEKRINIEFSENGTTVSIILDL